MRRIGIFAALRRRRLGLALAFGYALLLNALLASVGDAHALAMAMDPLSASAGSLCGTHPPDSDSNRSGDQHQHECPLCGPICPMGGCIPSHALAGSVTAGLPTIPTVATRIAWQACDGVTARSVYRSDPRAQAPPALA